jgi:hypothetical protein
VSASLSYMSLVAIPHAANLTVVIPLVIASLAIVLVFPIAAFQGALHIPGYCGFALLALAVGLSVGKIAGMQFPGSLAGVCLSSVFFLAMATCLGSILAIFLYRQPES